jgi:hypothetical protein
MVDVQQKNERQEEEKQSVLAEQDKPAGRPQDRRPECTVKPPAQDVT